MLDCNTGTGRCNAVSSPLIFNVINELHIKWGGEGGGGRDGKHIRLSRICSMFIFNECVMKWNVLFLHFAELPGIVQWPYCIRCAELRRSLSYNHCMLIVNQRNANCFFYYYKWNERNSVLRSFEEIIIIFSSLRATSWPLQLLNWCLYHRCKLTVFGASQFCFCDSF